MHNIYTYERRINQGSMKKSPIDLERAERRRKKRAEARIRRVAGRKETKRIEAVYRKIESMKGTVLTKSARGAYFFVFVGEWGYEILSSHGWLRKFKAKHPKVTIGVASRAGAEFLYEDACDIYVDIKEFIFQILFVIVLE